MEDLRKDNDLDVMLESLLADLPPEVRQAVAGWIRRARSESPERVGAGLAVEAGRMAERFRAAAAAVEKMMIE